MKFVPYPDASGLESLSGIWPEFLLHDTLSNRYWNRLYEDFPSFQFAALDGDRMVGEGNCVPVRGQPASWREAFPNAWEGTGGPDRVCALAIIVAPDARGGGRSTEMLAHMRELAAPFGLLVAPVRPTLKARYPLIAIDEYVEWRRDDGTHVDPWIRTHERAGGRIIGPAEDAMIIEGDRGEWAEWTGLEFPGDGDYVVPGALAPVRFAGGRGVYREPCVWIEHRAP